jgi:hypothetical protein
MSDGRGTIEAKRSQFNDGDSLRNHGLIAISGEFYRSRMTLGMDVVGISHSLPSRAPTRAVTCSRRRGYGILVPLCVVARLYM